MKELNIIQLGIYNLEKAANILGKWKPLAGKGPDGTVEFNLDGKKVKFYVEIKKELRGYMLPAIYDLAKRYHPLMMNCEHIFPKIKQALREHGIAYLEANGNVWLKQGKNLIMIDAEHETPKTKKNENRAFTRTGLKLLFEFLCDEKTANFPYRIIAERTGIALANIPYIMNGLQQLKFIAKTKNGVKFQNKKQLLEKWMVEYDKILKPDLEIGRFRFADKNDFANWQKLKLAPNDVCGGEPAASILTKYLHPGTLTLYTKTNRNELIYQYKLIPDPNGYFTIYHKFWHRDWNYKTTVPAVLVYAELMNTGDGRCIETAEKLFDKYLKDDF